MKTKEFIDKVEALGFQVYEEINDIKICDEVKGYNSNDPLFEIESNDIGMYAPGGIYIQSTERVNLLMLISEYLNTPIADREEEKRYRLRFIHPNILGPREPFYLHLHHSESAKDYYNMGTVKAPFGNKLQTIFTESELAEMDITGFVKEEVHD